MKTYLRRMLVGLTAIAAGLVAVLPASTATAATTKPNLVVPADVHTVYQRFYGYPTQANPGVSVTGVAACPSGTRLVGMGAGNGTVGALSPVQNFTAVRMTGVVTWPSPTYGGNFIQVELLCAPAGQFTDVKTVQVVDHRARNQRGHYLRDVAKCPGGYYAFGGGGYFSNNTGAAESGFESAYWIIGNGPTPDGTGWAFTGQAPYDAESMVVVTQCAPRVGQTLLNLTGTSTVPNPNPKRPQVRVPRRLRPLPLGLHADLRRVVHRDAIGGAGLPDRRAELHRDQRVVGRGTTDQRQQHWPIVLVRECDGHGRRQVGGPGPVHQALT